ncbi:MAG TPA: chromosomal replication initiator protein DnaA [Desulfobacterales bacterium]|nr:chromosomal replication initiator protein DnaA [Desulfobacterales bacterium]
MESYWEEVKHIFKGRLASSAYQLWIEPLQASFGNAGEFFLDCPNPFFLHWVRNHYLSDLEREYRLLTGGTTQIKLRLLKTSAKNKEDHSHRLQSCLPEISRPPSSGRLLNKAFTFEQFVVGASNRFAFQASRALAGNDAFYGRTLFLTAQPGLGKSHLSQAVGNYIQTNYRHHQVFYLTAEDFANEMVAALRQGAMAQFKDKFRRQCDTLLLEGVHFLSGKEKIQAELCYTLDCLADLNKKLVFTSPYLPMEIPHLKQELLSRFTGGVITPIDPPDFSTRVSILTRKAQDRQVQVPREVKEHLATYLTQDVRQMVSALDNLLLKAATLKTDINLDLANEVLRDFQAASQALRIEDIQKLTGQVYQVSQEELLGKSRKKKIVKARNLAIYLSHHYLQKQLKDLARSFRRTHSTIIHSLECVERDLKVSAGFAAELQYLEERLQTSRRWRQSTLPQPKASTRN